MNPVRLKTLLYKERNQLLRDPYSIAIGILLPIVLLLIFGYGMSMDLQNVRLAIVAPVTDQEVNHVIARFAASPTFLVRRYYHSDAGETALRDHSADACLYLPSELSRETLAQNRSAVLLTVNAVNATRARMIENNVRAILGEALAARLHLQAPGRARLEPRMWYNSANDSRYYMIPGVIVIIMSIIGTLLTALVMAREYEHGNLESMFVTPMRSSEMLIAKAANNFVLGMIGLVIALVAAKFLFNVPIRGNLGVLMLGSALYLVVALALGLLISSVTKNQFLACELTMALTFMPAFLLSGFLYEIDNMPQFVQYVTRIVPARYYVEFMQCVFLVGDVPEILWKNIAILFAFAVFFSYLACRWNPKSLESR